MRLLPERTAVRLGAVPYGARGPRPPRRFQEPLQPGGGRRGLRGDQPSGDSRRHLGGPPAPGVQSLLRPPGSDRVSQRPPQARAQRRAPALPDARHHACRGPSRPEPVAARPRGVAADSDRRGGRARGAGGGRARGGGSGSADSAADHSTADDSSGYSSAPPTVRGSAAAPVRRAFRIGRDAVRELADAADFLPGFAPPRTLSPEELAERMWKGDRPCRRSTRAPPARCGRRPSEPSDSPPRRSSGHPRATRSPRRSSRTSRESFRASSCSLRPTSRSRAGPRAAADLTRESVARVRIPWGEPSIFAFVKLSGSPHKGALSRILVAADPDRPAGPEGHRLVRRVSRCGSRTASSRFSTPTGPARRCPKRTIAASRSRRARSGARSPGSCSTCAGAFHRPDLVNGTQPQDDRSRSRRPGRGRWRRVAEHPALPPRRCSPRRSSRRRWREALAFTEGGRRLARRAEILGRLPLLDSRC